MSMAKRMGNKGSWVMYNVGDMVRDFGVLRDVFVCICILFYIVVIVMELDTSCRFLKYLTACKRCFIVCVYAASEGVEEYMDA